MMGRVTFQDPAVAKIVNESFVATWKNADPTFKGTDMRSKNEDLAPAFAKWWPSGHASSNVKTAISTGDGELVHVVPGFVRALELTRELEFAAGIGRTLESVGKDPVARAKAIAAAHRAKLAELEARWGKADPEADLDTDSLKPEEIRPDHFAQLMMRVHQAFLADPSRDRSDENGACWTSASTGSFEPQSVSSVEKEISSLKAQAAQAAQDMKASGPPPFDMPKSPPAGMRLGGATGQLVTQEMWDKMRADAQKTYDDLKANWKKDCQERLDRANRALAGAEGRLQRAKDSARMMALSNKQTALAVKKVGLQKMQQGAGLGSICAITVGDIECAKQAQADDATVELAIAAYSSRETNAAGWKKACDEVKALGLTGLRQVLERIGSPGEIAAYAVLRRVTGETIPDDENCWTSYVTAR